MHTYGYHPVLGVTIRSDGLVLVPQSGNNPAHWTFGCKGSNGYLQVSINGKKYRVHRLVAETFIPNPGNLPQTHHSNRNRADNRVENLSWVTAIQNNRDTIRTDRVSARGEKHYYDYKDKKQYFREFGAHRLKTHKYVLLSDGKQHWVPNKQATILLKLPEMERNFVRGRTTQNSRRA